MYDRRCVINAFVFVMIAMFACYSIHADPEQAKLQRDWLEKISKQHPRMFITSESWPTVKQYTLTHEKQYYEKIKRMADAMPVQADPKWEKGSNTLFGVNAQICAFVYLMEGDQQALAKAKNYLQEAVKFYNRQSTAGERVNWYSASRVQAMTAYDWIYHELSPSERKHFGEGLLKHYRDALDPNRRINRQNRGGITTGFYGAANMAWYVGLTLYNDGIDDEAAVELLKKGYEEHIELLDYRAMTGGDDGGIASLATGYSFGMYPWAEFNFMHTFKSATGIALSDTYTHHARLPIWVYWNYIPTDGPGKIWGLADAQHVTNNFHSAFLEMHMLQIAHFYAESMPEQAKFALWVRENLTTIHEHDNYWWPLAPFYLTNNSYLPEPVGPGDDWPLARYFESMGLVVMRSGNEVGDTFAAFVSGGQVNSHRHFDQGHFIIYKDGFVALDSSTYGDRSRSEHLTEYSNRTVAHNTILIRDGENDELPKIWGGPAKSYDGGQFNHDGKTLAFETNDRYAYVALDMTDAYSSKKASKVIRQFLFVLPDHFVVYDRVICHNPDAEKAVLLHTAREPIFDPSGKRFMADQDRGRIVVDAIYPEVVDLKVIGGPGKEFYSAGKNRPHTSTYDFCELWGQYRVESIPQNKQKEDTFLHLMRVGNQDITDTGLIEAIESTNGQKMQGVKFETTRGQVTVMFNASGPVGGEITFGDNQGSAIPLSMEVLPQSGIGLRQ